MRLAKPRHAEQQHPLLRGGAEGGTRGVKHRAIFLFCVTPRCYPPRGTGGRANENGPAIACGAVVRKGSDQKVKPTLMPTAMAELPVKLAAVLIPSSVVAVSPIST